METRENAEYEIDLKEIFYELIDKLWFIVAATAIFGLISILITKVFITPMYTSDTQLYVVSNQSNNGNISYSDLQASTQLTQDYIEIVKSRSTLVTVIENLGLDMTYGELLDNLTVVTPNNTRMLKIAVENEDPFIAKKIVDKIAEVTSKEICDKLGMDEVNIIYEGDIPTSPSSPNTMKNAVIGALLGFVLSAGTIIVMNILDDSIKSEEDVERYVGIPMLAAIPFSDELDDSVGSKKKKKGLKGLKK